MQRHCIAALWPLSPTISSRRQLEAPSQWDGEAVKNAKKRKLLVSAALLGSVLCYVWLSFGIYSDREFGGLRVFRKHQLSPRFFFYSPHGESDKPDTTEAERNAEQTTPSSSSSREAESAVGPYCDDPT